ncbi:cytochrome P450 monooxygenase-like protein [Thermochaetoides thermophila DSM 1495]|uniref:Cytochrome P450 monooxygenase-like protein n=1 Tax=Chaetomium thermophilum (strain DSM 1495 / CBS 144.50 / IMI 039719) TaxID=759272 RepID=G0SBF0_CHATD|nr:cytochrome P450 monooxygenase-like protein [Thermochaetoides thermophila DSM 1495]EGS19530.1 cytochrome P450 monooxygenase-like protein [Thermochaetoides thermophila DSM 1495]
MVLLQTIFEVLTTKIFIILPAICALLLSYYGLNNAFRLIHLAKIPLAEKISREKQHQAFLTNARALAIQRYSQFKNRVYRIFTYRRYPIIVLPLSELKFLRTLPDTVLSFDDAIAEDLYARYTGMVVGHHIIQHSVKTRLTPSLPRLNPLIAMEVADALEKELATNVFFDLAANPHHLPTLRSEIQSVLACHNNEYTTQALQSLKNLDSLLKESSRLHPPGIGAFTRKVLTPFTLPSGQTIPSGVFIEVPQYATNRDPEIFPNPDEFDPWRFAREREKAREKGLAEEAAQNQFVSVSPHGLTFGYGRHACPGRFFAANEIKMIVAQVVMGWELKMPDGVQGRWEDLCLGAGIVPDPTKSILMKRFRA